MPSYNRKINRKHIRRILLIMGLGMTLSPVRAELPDVSVFDHATEVDDSELGEIRGKFVSPGQVTYFGVAMQTQWQTGSGEVLTAGMKMDMNLPRDGNTQPTVSLVPTVSIVTNSTTNPAQPGINSPAQPGSSDTTITSKGINNISGVVQSIQVGGNKNSINNAIDMNVTITSSSVTESAVSQPLDLSPFSVEKSTDSGSVAFSGASHSGIQVYTYVPNQGEILQRIGASPDGDGNIMQNVRLVGDQHRVINTMTISASFSANSTSTVDSSLQLNPI